MKAVTRREIDMVAAWSVDRLGRSLMDLLEFLKELHAKGVDLFLHQQGLDTSTPSGAKPRSASRSTVEHSQRQAAVTTLRRKIAIQAFPGSQR
jgi:DNA invertase Pin-like site-specific DNA recombinase